MNAQTEQAISEAFNVIRDALDEGYPSHRVFSLVDAIEREYIKALRRVEILTLLASGDTPAETVSPPTPEKAVAPRGGERTEANNIVSIDPHRDRYSWRVEGAAS